MSDLKVSVVQCHLTWEDRLANLTHLGALLAQMNQTTDVIVLPEMFTTGFSMNTDVISELHHDQMETLSWMRKNAAHYDAVVCGSVSVKDHDQYYNRLYWVRPDGVFSMYDKRHTFSFAGEDKYYSRGAVRIIEEWRGWKICPLICYDLRFPVWSRNGLRSSEPNFDALIYVANWPEARRDPWMALLPARAIENQVYVAACNRIGQDGKNISYTGDSVLINPRGEILRKAEPGKEQILNAVFSRNELSDFRQKFPVLQDADPFQLT